MVGEVRAQYRLKKNGADVIGGPTELSVQRFGDRSLSRNRR